MENENRNNKNTVGQRIRNLRKEKGLTQKGLAEKVGVNEVTIRSYEADKFKPKTENLKKIAIALDTDIYELSPELKIRNSTIIEIINNRQYDKTSHINVLKMYEKSQDHILQGKKEYVKDQIELGTLSPVDEKKRHLLEYFDMLNNIGKDKALEQTEILTKVPEYQQRNTDTKISKDSDFSENNISEDENI